ncbi:hypothetical protein NDU88_001864 [Pleurodeles waltl]|uniref:Uncharacterized protein n=1 Tax=Pleurodeles waltl TaxID=8319 RepID=A0AAV7V8Z9_PLEWA|nr:hypothetical protein NDU88_001864 [Pleurodeles waltl]
MEANRGMPPQRKPGGPTLQRPPAKTLHPPPDSEVQRLAQRDCGSGREWHDRRAWPLSCPIRKEIHGGAPPPQDGRG